MTVLQTTLSIQREIAKQSHLGLPIDTENKGYTVKELNKTTVGHWNKTGCGLVMKCLKYHVDTL